ncbi:TRAP transporter large permease [Oceanispirochaeta sp. M1]|uniref:TRAP transporter large permease n=2 Tax=Oceanispirochaeta TaxID=2035349 RepID=UPI0020A6962F|nr:TRAP transporter large permease [Oceanispirochaeta sp. M1]
MTTEALKPFIHIKKRRAYRIGTVLFALTLIVLYYLGWKENTDMMYSDNQKIIATLMLVLSFMVLTFTGLQIAYSVLIAAIITTFYLGLPLKIVAQNMLKGIDSYALLAAPFFMVAGEIMGSGGISTRLIRLSRSLVGWIRGGLAHVNIVSSMFFGGISGSSAADTASIGTIMIPMMEKEGYDTDFATAVTMASSVQGILIPPSHNMVLYALAVGSVSIGKLFLGGMIPGIFLGIALMIYSYIISVKKNYPKDHRFDIKEMILAAKDAIWGLITVLIVVVGVIGGIFTATESAAIAVVWAFIVTFFIYREISFKSFYQIMTRALKTLSIVMILVACAKAFGYVVAYLQIPTMVANGLLSLSDNKYIILLLINLLMLVLGMIMDMASLILILAPILAPVAVQLGIDPVHFGVIMILNLGIGLITPPVGSTLFIGSAIAGIPIEKVAKSMLPFFIVMLLTLMVVTYVPIVVMGLPNLLMP